ncbi:aspartate/glutamate racemase family protein [Rhodovarius lipocyclicus]|uniref:aspartate/glutamate racemase family protein n=1 Tax=Rhodovarius lipocyclicus TaxID=268410 RepID=UPI001356E95C|nr:aspartate/glutamate racemase family protein [Rhodovarius lipocyclicus]
MKLLVINGNTDAAITDLVLRHARAALPRLGLSATLVGATARFGARYIASRAASAIAGHAVLDALAEHLTPDTGAVVIACFGDPGLEAAREISPVPVVAMADASLRIAFRQAGRVALITGGAAWVPMLQEFCLVRGHGPDRVSVLAVAPTGGMIAADPQGAIALLAQAARDAAADGAGAVVLGGAGLAGLAPRVAAASGVPVLDSLDCSLIAAFDAVAAPYGQPTPTVGLSPPLTALLG